MFSELILAKSFPAAIRRVREHRRARPPHRADHRRPRLRRSGRCARCSTTSCAPALDAPTRRHVHGRARRRAAHRRDPGPGAGRLRRRPTASTCASRVAYADSTRDLPDARGRRLPGGGQPRDPPGRPGPQAGLAGRALAPRRPAGPGRSLPIGPTPPRRPGRPAFPATVGVTMKALRFERNLPRFAAAMVAGTLPAGRAAPGSARCARRHRPPELPGPRLGARPAPPGRHLRQRPRHHRRHVVALLRADRVVPVRARPRGRGRPRRRHAGSCVEPVLGCVARGIDPPCAACAGATSATASASPSATSSPACRPASAATPAAAGRRRWWPTPASSTPCPTT